MNMLEQYIQPGWTTEPITDPKDLAECKKYGLNADEMIKVHGNRDCYGDTAPIRPVLWFKDKWESAVKDGYYMA